MQPKMRMQERHKVESSQLSQDYRRKKKNNNRQNMNNHNEKGQTQFKKKFNWLTSGETEMAKTRVQPIRRDYSLAQLFTTPAGGALPARSGSGEKSKLKLRAQPRSVTWKGKKLSKRSMPASTHSSTSSGRPTPCSSLQRGRQEGSKRKQQSDMLTVETQTCHMHPHVLVLSVVLFSRPHQSGPRHYQDERVSRSRPAQDIWGSRPRQERQQNRKKSIFLKF